MIRRVKSVPLLHGREGLALSLPDGVTTLQGDDPAPLKEAQEAVERMRTGRVHLHAGYDGEFGVIKAFTEEERQEFSGQGVLFPDMPPIPSKARKAKASASRIQDYKKKQKRKKKTARA